MKRKFEHVQKERSVLELVVLGLLVDLLCDDESPGIGDDDVELCELLLVSFLKLESDKPRDDIGEPSRRHCASFDAFTPSECLANFRFRKQDLPRLMRALQIPDELKVGSEGHQCVFSGEEGLLLLLRRLAYPCRWIDLVDMFGLFVCEMSTLFAFMVHHVYDTFGQRLLDIDVWVPHLPSFRDAIVRRGAPSPLNVWCFVDGTLRGMCRPSQGQESQFSGHKRIHGLKFESVVIPNGIIARLFGPEDGRRHDITLARKSGLYEALSHVQQLAIETWGRSFEGMLTVHTSDC